MVDKDANPLHSQDIRHNAPSFSTQGLDMLRETLRFREGDLGAFVARFMQYTSLQNRII